MSLDVQSYTPEEWEKRKIQLKERQTRAPKDTVGAPVFPSTEKRLSIKRDDAKKLVEQQLKLGKNPELLLDEAQRSYDFASWARLQHTYDVQNNVENATEFWNDPTVSGIEQRAKLDVLIPVVAKARVQNQAKWEASPVHYVDELRQQLKEKQQYIDAQRDIPDEQLDQYAFQLALDDAKMLKEMIVVAANLSHEKTAWFNPNSDLPNLAGITKQREEKLVLLQKLQEERKTIPFWNIFQKTKLDRDIQQLNTDVQQLAQDEKEAKIEIGEVPNATWFVEQAKQAMRTYAETKNYEKVASMNSQINSEFEFTMRQLGGYNLDETIPYNRARRDTLRKKLEEMASKPGETKGARVRRRQAQLAMQLLRAHEILHPDLRVTEKMPYTVRKAEQSDEQGVEQQSGSA